MDWFFAVGVVVLVAIVMVGLFHGPSRRDAPTATRRRARGGRTGPGAPTGGRAPTGGHSAPTGGRAPTGHSAPTGRTSPGGSGVGTDAPGDARDAAVEESRPPSDPPPVSYVLPPSARRRPRLGRRPLGRPGGRRA